MPKVKDKKPSKNNAITTALKFDKETPNTWKFTETEFPDGDYYFGSIYVRKKFMKTAPKGIFVTVTPA
jgi:hypothetical protein